MSKSSHADVSTLYTICEVDGTQLLTIFALSVKRSNLAGLLLTQNRCNFSHIKGATAWLYDCPPLISPLHITEKCYDKIPVNFFDTHCYVC